MKSLKKRGSSQRILDLQSNSIDNNSFKQAGKHMQPRQTKSLTKNNKDSSLSVSNLSLKEGDRYGLKPGSEMSGTMATPTIPDQL